MVEGRKGKSYQKAPKYIKIAKFQKAPVAATQASQTEPEALNPAKSVSIICNNANGTPMFSVRPKIFGDGRPSALPPAPRSLNPKTSRP